MSRNVLSGLQASSIYEKLWPNRLKMIPSSPRYLQLYPTFRCNQRCVFCFNSAMPGSASSSDMSRTDARRLIALCAAHGIPEIDVMGGEPFLLPWMPDFLGEAISNGIRINVSTNGSLPDMAVKLAGLDPGLLTIGISLEGSTGQKHDRLTSSSNFDVALASLSRLVDAGLNPLIKTVVSRETMPDIPAIIRLIRGFGVGRYFLIHMDALGDGRSAAHALGYPEFLEFWKEMRDAHPDMEIGKVAASCFDRGSLPSGVRCAGGVRKLAVAPDGAAYPCNLFLGVAEFCLGNVLTDGMDAVWISPRLEFFRKTGDNACPNRPCGNYDNCTGGCPAHAYHRCGNATGPDLRCCPQTMKESSS